MKWKGKNPKVKLIEKEYVTGVKLNKEEMKLNYHYVLQLYIKNSKYMFNMKGYKNSMDSDNPEIIYMF